MIRRVVIVVAAVLIGAAACGIPSDDEPRSIPEGALPEQVREPGGTGATSTTSRTGATSEQTLYLVSAEAEERLVPFPGQVLSADPSQLPRLTLEALIQTRPENVGLAGVATNQLPSDVQVIDANVQPDGVLNLNLSSLGIESSRLRLAMAQIVFTATDLRSSGINSVRVSIDGELAAVPTQSGNADPGTPVSKSDYADLDPQITLPAE